MLAGVGRPVQESVQGRLDGCRGLSIGFRVKGLGFMCLGYAV